VWPFGAPGFVCLACDVSAMTELVARRDVLRGTGLALGASLAGCVGGGGGDSEVTTPNQPTLSEEPDYGGWFEEVSNYRDTYDFTDADEVTVAVGAPGNGGDYAFEPAAIAVTTGTRVVWDWTGEAGPHNVVANDGAFASEKQSGADVTFSHQFGSPGMYKYLCQPHATFNMQGAVVVRE
jgi:halocyanin-like protein